jgi:hypothetical protein
MEEERSDSSRRLTRPARGRLVANVLRGVWRSTPPDSLDLTEESLAHIAPLLARAGSGGLAWWRLRGTPLADAPDVQPLRDLYRYYTLQMSHLEHQLSDTVRFLRAAGVEPIPVKGWAMGRLYPERGLRPYGDVDLAVASSQYDTAAAALEDPDRPPCPVELHPTFAELPDRSFEEIFERSHLVELHDTEIRVLAHEDHLRLLALHALNHAFWRPLWLCDLAVMMESLSDHLDWELCMTGDPWRSQGVRCALKLAGELLGADMSAVPPTWLEPPLPTWMVPAALRSWGAEAHYMSGPHMEEYLRDPRHLLRGMRLRWPNPIEATYRVRAPYNNLPRLSFQIAETVHRTAAFIRRLPHRRRTG